MKKVFTSLTFTLIFCVTVFSQTTETLPCPTLSVAGPAGIPQPDEIVTFTADVSEEAKKYDLKYRWSVSNATIVEGQGTLSLKILPKDLYGESLTATIEIIGLPENCGAMTASESLSTICLPEMVLFDEFTISASRIDKARLENLANELQKNPSVQGYILEKFDSSVSKKAVEAKNRKIFDYFKTINFEKDRITIVNGLAKENSTQFFIVPAGAIPPVCDDCIKTSN